MEKALTITDLQARIDEMETEAHKLRQMAQRADELADQCETPEGEAILRSEADNIWFAVGEYHDRIERMQRTMAMMSAEMSA